MLEVVRQHAGQAHPQGHRQVPPLVDRPVPRSAAARPPDEAQGLHVDRVEVAQQQLAGVDADRADLPGGVPEAGRVVGELPAGENERRGLPGTRYGAPMPEIKKFQVTFDCAEPERLARFWCEVLGYVLPPPPEGYATWDDFNRTLPPDEQGSWFACSDPSGVGPRLYFQRVPEGKIVKNRVHLDVRVGTGLVGDKRLATLEAECARLVALGATHVQTLYADEENESCIPMLDIEGNEFCID